MQGCGPANPNPVPKWTFFLTPVEIGLKSNLLVPKG